MIGQIEGNPSSAYLAEVDETIEYMLDPISGSAAKGRRILGIVCIHVDDAFMSGSKEFRDIVILE